MNINVNVNVNVNINVNININNKGYKKIMEYVPFYAIVKFFDVYDLLILRQVSKYYERNVRKIAKIDEFELFDFDYGLAMVEMFDNITFKISYVGTYTQEILNYKDLYNKITNLEIYTNVPRKKYKKFTKLTKLLVFDQDKIYDYHFTKQLKYLNMFCCDDIIDEQLKKSPNIETLFIQSPCITNNGLRYLNKLKELMINDSLITNEGLKHIPQLKKLDIELGEDIDGIGLRYLPDLESLSFTCGQTMITDDDFKYLGNLTELRLYDNKYEENGITDFGLQYLKNIKILHFCSDNKITNEGIKHMKNLKTLRLKGCSLVTDECFKYFPNLTSLYLEDNKMITDEGLWNINISSSGLKFLDLQRKNNITNIGLSYCRNLTDLNLEKNNMITYEGLKYLSGPKMIHLNLKLSGIEENSQLDIFPELKELSCCRTYEGLFLMKNLKIINLLFFEKKIDVTKFPLCIRSVYISETCDIYDEETDEYIRHHNENINFCTYRHY